MKIIADLHIHSKYARACSKDLNPFNLAIWAEKKGINILGTGDCLHPQWLSELKEQLKESKPGLYSLKAKGNNALFMLTTEVASIYKQGDKVRRVHNLIFFPNFAAVDKLTSILEEKKVNLKSDGRPIMGVTCPELVRLCKQADQNIEVVPAHAWTPHFGVFGSLSGFDSLAEAFGDQVKHIFAIETGLSSDPKMNWQIPELGNISLISNSDAHSLRKLGREANVLDVKEQKLSYLEIINAIKNKDKKSFIETLEFFPEEGKYHLDGHADCKFSCLPQKTNELKGLCPVCGKKILRGVLHRIEQLSQKNKVSQSKNKVSYRSLIPLEEIIAESFGVGVASKKVLEMYERMVATAPEFTILLDLSENEITKISNKKIAESIFRVRIGKVHIEAGYDGIFGKIHIYEPEEKLQKSLPS